MKKKDTGNFIPKSLSDALDALTIIDTSSIKKSINDLLVTTNLPSCDDKQDVYETKDTGPACLPKIMPQKERDELLQKELDKSAPILNTPIKFDGESPDCVTGTKNQISTICQDYANSVLTDFPQLVQRIPNSIINFYSSLFLLSYQLRILYFYDLRFGTTYFSNKKSLLDIKISSDNIILGDLLSMITTNYNNIKNYNATQNDIQIGSDDIDSKTGSCKGYITGFTLLLSNNLIVGNVNDVVFNCSINGELDSGLIFNILNSITKDTITDDDKKTGKYFDKINSILLPLYSVLNNSLLNVLNDTTTPDVNAILVNIKSVIGDLIKEIDNNSAKLSSALGDLIKYYDSSNINLVKADLISKLKDVVCCGKNIINPDDLNAPLSNAPPDNNSPQDISYNTFSKPGNPGMLELKYWQVYAGYVTLVGLLPQYWAKGVMIPTPGGPLFIPVPIIWTPLFVIHTPVNIMVLFLTINGMLPFPVLWELRFLPLADSQSSHLTAVRGGNIMIKMQTGDKPLNQPIVAGIDVSPEISKHLPYQKDDIPTFERLSMANPPYLLYLNQWNQKIQPYMGFQP